MSVMFIFFNFSVFLLNVNVIFYLCTILTPPTFEIIGAKLEEMIMVSILSYLLLFF